MLFHVLVTSVCVKRTLGESKICSYCNKWGLLIVMMMNVQWLFRFSCCPEAINDIITKIKIFLESWRQSRRHITDRVEGKQKEKGGAVLRKSEIQIHQSRKKCPFLGLAGGRDPNRSSSEKIQRQNFFYVRLWSIVKYHRNSCDVVVASYLRIRSHEWNGSWFITSIQPSACPKILIFFQFSVHTTI